MDHTSSHLRADLYNAPAIPTNESLPDGSVGLWQPTVVTLISGKHEAVLVDTLFTSEQGVALGDWLEDTLGPKRLAYIYITHGHGDHWFNLQYLTQRFPGVKVVATRDSVRHMSTQITPEFRAFFQNLFPGQIPDESFRIMAEPLEDNKFFLEGHLMQAVPVGHSDTEGTSFLHVPDLNLAVAGDIVYNDVHMWMVESPSQKERSAWIRSLDQLEAYKPAIVIGSHHRPGGVDGAFNIAASREYIQTFSRLAEKAKSAEDLYTQVQEACPTRIGKLVLWLSCKAVVSSQQ